MPQPATQTMIRSNVRVCHFRTWSGAVATSALLRKNEPALAGGAGGAVGRLRLAQLLFERAQVTGGRSVLRIEGSINLHLKTGAPNEREAHQPAAPAHDRRHDGAQLRREDAQRLYPARQDIHNLSRPRAGYGRA